MNYLSLFLIIVVLTYSYWQGYTPLLVALIYLLVSLVAVVVYAIDKRAAINEDQRTPESTLHLLALFGGWPGAIIAQQAFRHKTKKVKFRVFFWFTLLFNSAALFCLHTADGNRELHLYVSKIEVLIFNEIPSGDFRRMLLTFLRFGS